LADPAPHKRRVRARKGLHFGKTVRSPTGRAQFRFSDVSGRHRAIPFPDMQNDVPSTHAILRSPRHKRGGKTKKGQRPSFPKRTQPISNGAVGRTNWLGSALPKIVGEENHPDIDIMYFDWVEEGQPEKKRSIPQTSRFRPPFLLQKHIVLSTGRTHSSG